MRITIIEGARGTGKSSIARAIREKIPEITLINATGYHLDGSEGLEKISEYYWNWIDFIGAMKFHDSTFVFDRFFFSERVFSELYKNYDFKGEYSALLRVLTTVSDEIDIMFFTIDDEEELKTRLIRDKVPFGKAEESVIETLKQQEVYKDIMNHVDSEYSGKIRFHRINTTGKSIEEIEKEVISIVGGKNV